jgi:anti-anti-sigma regulatory factor
MLRIGRSVDDGRAILVLSGRIEERDVPEIERLLEVDRQVTDIILDLEEVRLVDRQAVKFLAACEARGIKLKNCPAYVREWIESRSDKS